MSPEYGISDSKKSEKETFGQPKAPYDNNATDTKRVSSRKPTSSRGRQQAIFRPEDIGVATRQHGRDGENLKR
jgi:hypothetical protein